MASVISDLKMAVADPGNRVSDLLRQALLIAGELGLDEFREWIDKELNGYTVEETEAGKLPSYRALRATVQGFNPHHGWRPVMFENPETGEKFSKMPIPFPVSRIEDFGTGNLAFTFVEPTQSEIRKSVSKSTGFEVDIRRFVDGTSYRGIVDAVRNQILDWAMKLEDAGVAGEGNKFTPKEKSLANSAPTFHIEHVANVMVVGDVSGQARVNVEQNAPFSGVQLEALPQLLDEIESFKGKLGLKNTDLTGLDTHLGEIREELATGEPSPGKVRQAIGSLVRIVEGAASGVISSGIVTKLSQFF